MTAARRSAPGARRRELVAAARDLFSARGVDSTSIEDITRAAGVAHGTFYLYFKTKDDAINAVMAEIAGEKVADVASAAATSDLAALEKLALVRSALVGLSALAPSASGGLVAHYHGPEHADVHDRLAHEVNRQLLPVLAAVIEQGVREGVFSVSDPRASAAFALSASEGLDLLEPSEGSVDALMTFIMRGLGANA